MDNRLLLSCTKQNQMTDKCVITNIPENSHFVCTCAGLTAGVALFADVTELVEALWAALDTQFGALQLQERRRTGPAGLGSWSRAPLTGPVTFLTVGSLFVIPEDNCDNYQHLYISCLSSHTSAVSGAFISLIKLRIMILAVIIQCS